LTVAGERFEDYRCEGCGMAWSDYGREHLAPAARSIAPRWRDLVTGIDDTVLGTSPSADAADGRTWSAKEYGWHLGSVLDYMAAALERMAGENDVQLDYYAHEQDVADAEPNRRDLDEITTRIDRGSSRLAAVLASVDLDEWDHEADFPWGRRDLMDMARNAIHEGEHHLDDVEQVIGTR
ncbi:MAG: DinB family protein, partial [Nitriliruptorales bacterium]|nr:DinB family protein [Nitriliruptorales bacterium]